MGQSSETAACSDCPIGQYNDQTANPVNSYFASPAPPNCLSCPPGTWQDETGKSSCKNCAAGKSTGSTAASPCTDCQAGQMQPFLASSRLVDVNDIRGCILCPSGSYQPQEGKSACLECPAGQAAVGNWNSGSTSASSTCQVCPLDTYSAAEARQVRQGDSVCQSHSWSQQNCLGAGSCAYTPGASEADSAAMYPPNIANPSCSGAGTVYATMSRRYCAQCAWGQYNDETGQTTCKGTACVAGQIGGNLVNGRPRNCVDCSPGYFNGHVTSTATSCQECPSGEFRVVGQHAWFFHVLQLNNLLHAGKETDQKPTSRPSPAPRPPPSPPHPYPSRAIPNRDEAELMHQLSKGQEHASLDMDWGALIGSCGV